MLRVAGILVMLGSLGLCGCELTRMSRRPAAEPGPETLRKTPIDYVDADGFDVLFESALINRDPIIIIRTPNEKPDWTGRLNAWIAAWNMGKPANPRVSRGQIPVPNIDGDTLREFRLLIASVVDRAEDASKAGVAWFREERTRSRRVELLRPYNLRFHMNEDGKIHLIFFHGAYAKMYPQAMMALTECAGESNTWSRTYECSHRKKARELAERRETPVDSTAARIPSEISTAPALTPALTALTPRE